MELYLDCCLGSIRNQTYDRLEIIVVEDCSTDRSAARAQPHLADPRIKLIRHAQNLGLSAARNTGIEAATGDYIMFVDSDDAIAPRLVEACVAHATATSADLVVYDFAPFYDGDALPEFRLGMTPLQARRLDRSAYLRLPHFAWLKFIRAGVVRDNALRFPLGYYYEDWPFHWELGFCTANIGQLCGAGVAYRQHESAITRSNGIQLFDLFKVQKLVLYMVGGSGDADAGKVFAHKVYAGFWSVLTRIDATLLPVAIRRASLLQSELRRQGCICDFGMREIALFVILVAPYPVAYMGVKALRGVRRLARILRISWIPSRAEAR